MTCRWITLATVIAAAATARADEPSVLSESKKQHWAWKRPATPSPLPVQDRSWIKNPIDAFVLAKLEAAGIRPAAPASREQLIRRVTFDLIGLPPTPEEIDAFVHDPAPDAWEKVIERLLSSPHYGERWGRHWLDVARFAESNGYEHDEVRPDAWRYRDYVIRSFNADKPFDQFIKEQLAGDELYPDDHDGRIATGFNLLGPDMTDTTDLAQRRQDKLNDMTDTAGLAFLGLTVACARCHDHKFEPIPQADYYRLQAFFTPATFRHDLPIASEQQLAAYAKSNQQYLDLTKPIRDTIAGMEEPYRRRIFDKKLARLPEEAQTALRTPAAKRTQAQQEIVAITGRLVVVSTDEIHRAFNAADKSRLQKLQDDLKRHDDRKPAPLPVTLGILDNGGPPPKTFLLERGDLGSRGAEVVPGYPIVLLPSHIPSPPQTPSPRPMTSGRRAALAEWIASPNNPLTARVLVNRLWQHHFGRGIVATASDFGLRGEPPTHPELLDWLATDFVDHGWSIKHMHRRVLRSATYQQSTRTEPATREKDPYNLLLSRMYRMRLEGEVIRDSLLTVSGRLNQQLGGPGVFPPIPAEALEGSKGWKASADPRDHARRSVYIFARRNLRFPLLEAFDLPDSNLSCPKRERSTTAPQALALLNDEDSVRAAEALAARVERDAKRDAERIDLAYRLAWGRQPTERERQLAQEFLQRSPLSELCRALFNANEFVYLE